VTTEASTDATLATDAKLMLGNVIDDQLTSSGGVLQGEGAVFSILFLLVLIAPMIYYVVATNRSSRGAA
jgi:ABC-type spermidine/putrescine transport system permease subunit I